jgi:hypothetical protein
MATNFRNKNLFCDCCGGEYKIVYPIEIPELGKKITAFEALHQDCKQTWTEPKADQNKSIEEKAIFWLQNGERGMSSEAMCFHLMGKTGSKSHPWDPDDFRRCYLLLKAVPEWNGFTYRQRMKSLSPEWARLIDQWDKLTGMLEEQMTTRKPNGMYELMLECINGTQP